MNRPPYFFLYLAVVKAMSCALLRVLPAALWRVNAINELGGALTDVRSQVEQARAVSKFDSFADPTERQYAQAQARPSDDFDPYSHHNEDTPDPFIEKFAELSLNTPLPEKFPALTNTESFL